MAGEDVIRPQPPSPKTSDTGKFLVIRLSTKSASARKTGSQPNILLFELKENGNE